jgi:type II secretory ATPase GspE/PulE/Tfp pilus assembly ATPase PilB-like protein
MVGEILDTENAEHAVQVPGFLISSTVLGILAQRLVRVICATAPRNTN